MSVRDTEGELFDQLWRNRKLREWLLHHKEQQVKVLVAHPDMEQIRRAQGATQFIDSMLTRMDAAESLARKNNG